MNAAWIMAFIVVPGAVVALAYVMTLVFEQQDDEEIASIRRKREMAQSLSDMPKPTPASARFSETSRAAAYHG